MTGRPWRASRSPPSLVFVLTPLAGRLAPLIGGLDDKARSPARAPGGDPAHRRPGDRRRHPGADGDPDRSRRPVPRDLRWDAARGGARTARRPPRRHPEREARRRDADRAGAGDRLRRDVRARDAAGHRRPRPRLGRLSAHDPVDRVPGQPGQPDRRDGFARRRDRGDRRRRLRHPVRVVRPHGRRGAVGDRMRIDAGLPVPQLPPGEDLHGRLGGARARLPARHARGRRRAQDGRRDHARRAAARARRADPRHVVRGAQAPQVPPRRRGAPTTTTSITGSCASASRRGAPPRTCTCGR